jgi:hypothetical protein
VIIINLKGAEISGKMKAAGKILPASLLILMTLSCTTLGSTVPEVTDIQGELIQGAQSLLGKNEIIVRGKRFSMDCTGVVLAIYYHAGIDLTKDFSSYTGNGVARLYYYLADQDFLYNTLAPQPGDIIFWDNTYDQNEDGRWNDTFTHTGMVVQASEWGTIDYVHHNYRKGIVLERMNLKEPDVHEKEIDGSMVIINSPMRMRSSPKGPGWLASHLYRDFGRGYELPRD